MSKPFGGRLLGRLTATLSAAALALGVGLIPGTAHADPTDQSITDGTLTWGFRASFRNYLTGPAKGTVTLDGVQENGGNYLFSPTTGSYDPGAKTGQVEVPGKVTFTGHEGKLEIHLSDLKVKLRGDGADLVADVKSRKFVSLTEQGELVSHDDVVLVNLTGAPKVADGKLQFNSTKSTLAPKGAEVLAPFLQQGAEMDPVSIDAKLTPKTQPAPPPPPSPSPSPDKPRPPHDPQPGVPGHHDIVDGYLDWGVHTQLRQHLAGDIAKGKVDLDGIVAHGDTLRWSPVKGKINSSEESLLAVGGSIHMTGYSGRFDMRIANVRVVFAKPEGANLKARLLADITSVPPAQARAKADAVTHKDLHLADLEGTLKVDKGWFSFSATPKLTVPGQQIFGSRMKPGDALDPLTLVGGAQGAKPEDMPGKLPSPAPEPSKPAPAPNPGKPTPDKPAPGKPAPAPKPSKPAPGRPATDCTVETTTGDLSWGIKSSFTSYIRGGIAKGDWKLSGVKWDGKQFVWPLTTAKFGDGTQLSYSGTITFSGHNGVLNMKLSDPRIVVKSATMAELYFGHVRSSDMNGKVSEFSNVHFATLSGNIKVDAKNASAQGLSATLSADGAKAFAGFYEAGAQLDPVSFTAKTGTKTTKCDDKGKPLGKTKLPRTGVDDESSAAAAFLGLVVLGGAAARKGAKR